MQARASAQQAEASCERLPARTGSRPTLVARPWLRCGQRRARRKKSTQRWAYRLLSRAPPLAAQGKARGRSQKDSRLLHRAAPAARNGRSPLPGVDTRQLPACAARHRADERARARGGAKPSARRSRRRATKNARTRAAQPRAAGARARRRTLPTRRAGRVRGTRLRKPAREGMKLSYRRPAPLSRTWRGPKLVESSAALPRSSRGRTRLPSPRARRTARVARKQEAAARAARLWLHGGTAALRRVQRRGAHVTAGAAAEASSGGGEAPSSAAQESLERSRMRHARETAPPRRRLLRASGCRRSRRKQRAGHWRRQRPSAHKKQRCRVRDVDVMLSRVPPQRQQRSGIAARRALSRTPG